MASYAREVKSELARIFEDEPEYLRAELAALLKFGAFFAEGQINFSTTNAAISRKIITLLKKLYPDAKKEVAILRRKKFIGRTRYVIRIFLTSATEDFFNKFNSPEIITDDFAKVSYLRGAFLAGGTVNRPEKSYYFEIAALSEDAANFIGELLRELDFNPSFHVRNEFFVNYICEGDAVLEFLAMIGVEELLERFEIARNLKEVRANVNRLVNVETANLNKSVDASQRQLQDIHFLLDNKVPVTKDLKLTMKTRLKFPECTVGELAEKLFISRQGLNYRFKRIHQLASKLEQELNSPLVGTEEDYYES